jgi:phenylacetate-CoA ligase
MGMLVSSGVRHADLGNRHYCDWIAFLRSTERWSADQIADYQLRQIQEMVQHAYLKTVGYRRLFDQAGVGPHSIKRTEDIQCLPFVEREMIRDHLEDYSAPVPGRTCVTTGGSTGIPFGFYRDKVAFSRELASKAYQYYRVGWKEGARQIVFRGLPLKAGRHMQMYPRLCELRCSSYHLIPEVMEVYRKRAFDYRPEWVKCYPSAAYIFAKFLKETRRPFPPVKGVLCASENLYGFQKELIAEVFQARVFSHYGHYELAALAGFCEYDDTYHVLPQYGYVELLDRDGKVVTQPGQMGEIVATSFLMRATPFIRYRTRDVATLKSHGCSACGRPYQIWETIDGRLQEFAVTAAGRLISMTAVNMHDDIFDHVRQFQFHQREQGRIVFRYIPRGSCTDSVVRNMKTRLVAKFGDDVRLEMRAVNDIPLTPRGKHRFLIQELKLGFGDN